MTSLPFAASADVVSLISCSPTYCAHQALALQRGDIDFHGRFMNIQRSFSHGKIETPKNRKPRRVDMSLQLRDALKDVKLERRLEAVKKGMGWHP